MSSESSAPARPENLAPERNDPAELLAASARKPDRLACWRGVHDRLFELAVIKLETFRQEEGLIDVERREPRQMQVLNGIILAAKRVLEVEERLEKSAARRAAAQSKRDAAQAAFAAPLARDGERPEGRAPLGEMAPKPAEPRENGRPARAPSNGKTPPPATVEGGAEASAADSRIHENGRAIADSRMPPSQRGLLASSALAASLSDSFGGMRIGDGGFAPASDGRDRRRQGREARAERRARDYVQNSAGHRENGGADRCRTNEERSALLVP